MKIERLLQLQERWGLTSAYQVIMVIIGFGINGSFAAWVAHPATAFVGLDSTITSPWIYWPVRLFLVFLIYQVTLPIVGFLLGQYRFFSLFTRKMLSRMGMGFLAGLVPGK
jgi:hypothetical protein